MQSQGTYTTLDEVGFKHPNPASPEKSDVNNYCLPETIVDKDKWMPCPDCYPEYWEAAYQKYLIEEFSDVRDESLTKIGLMQEEEPTPPGYPSPYSHITKYIQILPKNNTDVMLLGLITEQESTIRNLETRLENAINRGAAGRIEQESKINKLESEQKQFIMGSKTKKDTCEECWLCGKSHPEEELC